MATWMTVNKLSNRLGIQINLGGGCEESLGVSPIDAGLKKYQERLMSEHISATLGAVHDMVAKNE